MAFKAQKQQRITTEPNQPQQRTTTEHITTYVDFHFRIEYRIK